MKSVACSLYGLRWLGLLALMTTHALAQPVPAPEVDSLKNALPFVKPDTNRVKLLLRLGAYYLYKPLELQVDLDSARDCARQAGTLSLRLRFRKGREQSLELLGNISLEAQDIPLAKFYYQSLMQSAWRVNDLRGVGRGYLLLAKTYSGNPVDSLPRLNLLRKSIEYYHRAGDKKAEGEIWRNLADLHQSYGRYGQALQELKHALQMDHQPPFGSLHFDYDLMAHVYQQIGDYGEAVNCSIKSIEQAQILGDTSHNQTFYLRLGWLYYELNEWEEGIAYMKKVSWLSQQFKQADRVLYTAETITDGLIYQKKYREALEYALKTLNIIRPLAQQQPPNLISQTAEARMLSRVYFYNGQYPAAHRYYTQYLRLLELKDTYPQEWAQAYADVGKFYLATNNFTKARFYLDKALSLRQQLGNKAFLRIRDIYYQYFRLDSLQGNYQAALRHYQLYKIFTDSIFNQARSRQIATLRVQYDTQKKEQNLRLKDQNIQLLLKQGELQQASIQHARLLRNVTLGGIVMLLLLLAVLYNRYRLKQHNNRRLQAQQEEMKAQQEEISAKNERLSQLLGEKETLLVQKDTLIGEKESLLKEKDALLTEKDYLLVEKEYLLKEIHHRVKNNLQIVMSLLNSQANTLQDLAALSAIRESQNRVQAMALIHQKLYQAEGVARVAMPEYIEEAIDHLQNTYPLAQLITFHLMIDPVELDATQAVPLGLILNEAVTNACKYAFPNGRSGVLEISLKRLGENGYELKIKDDGIGLSPDYNPAQSRSLGMTLIHGFSKQLDGELSIVSAGGLTIRLVFRQEKIHTSLLTAVPT